MILNLDGERFDHLPGTFEVSMSEDVKQTVVAKLLLGRVLGLVKTIGIDKQRAPLDAIYLLSLIVQFIPEADGRIGFHVKEVAMMFATADNRRVMAGIAEPEMT